MNNTRVSYLADTLVKAIRSNKTDFVTQILNQGFPINMVIKGSIGGVVCSFTPLQWAVACRNIKIVKALLDAGADSNANCATYLIIQLAEIAKQDVDFEIIDALIQGKNRPAKSALGMTLLLVTQFEKPAKSRLQTINKLIAAGASLDVTSINGETALHWAVSNGSLETIKALLLAGAEPNTESNAGKKPLECADKNHCWQIAQVFVDCENQRLESQKPSVMIENMLEKALEGDVTAIMKAADYFQTKKTYGRALLFSCIAAVYLGSESPLYAKYHEYIANFKSDYWFDVNNYRMLELKTFYLRCLAQHQNKSSYLAHLKQLGFANPIDLMLFAVDNEINNAKQDTKKNSSYLDLVLYTCNNIRSRLEGSIRAISCYKKIHDKCVNNRERYLKQVMDFSKLPKGMISDYFLKNIAQPKEDVSTIAPQVLEPSAPPVAEVVSALESKPESSLPSLASSVTLFAPAPASSPPSYEVAIMEEEGIASKKTGPGVN